MCAMRPLRNFKTNQCCLEISKRRMEMLNWMDSLKGRSMMRLASFTDEEMLNLIDLAAQLKARRAAGVRGDLRCG